MRAVRVVKFVVPQKLTMFEKWKKIKPSLRKPVFKIISEQKQEPIFRIIHKSEQSAENSQSSIDYDVMAHRNPAEKEIYPFHKLEAECSQQTSDEESNKIEK